MSSFDRLGKTIYLIVDPDASELYGTAVLDEQELADFSPAWERQGMEIRPWHPTPGDRVRFCEAGGGEGEITIATDHSGVKVQWDDGTWSIHDAIMLDPITVVGLVGEMEIC